MRNSCVLLTLAMAAFAQDAIRPKDVRNASTPQGQNTRTACEAEICDDERFA
jgi:hypothetical protein